MKDIPSKSRRNRAAQASEDAGSPDRVTLEVTMTRCDWELNLALQALVSVAKNLAASTAVVMALLGPGKIASARDDLFRDLAPGDDTEADSVASGIQEAVRQLTLVDEALSHVHTKVKQRLA